MIHGNAQNKTELNSHAIFYNDIIEILPFRYGTISILKHDTHVSRSITRYGEFSESECALFRQLLKPGMTALDVGANIGALTIPMSQMVAENGRVVALEPQKLVYQTLACNALLNQALNIEIINHVVSDRCGQVYDLDVLDFAIAGNYGGYSLAYRIESDKTYTQKKEKVSSITIDSLPLDRCDLIKIDVEGMEVDVLLGAGQTIQRHRPIVYMEKMFAYTRDGVFDNSSKQLELIKSYGYKVFLHQAPMYNPDNFFNNFDNVFMTKDNVQICSFNFLCIPTERKLEVSGADVV